MNLEQLYTEHYKSVYYTCYKYLQNEEDAKDMAQNVFIKAFDKIDTLKDTSSFKSWINRIAANECINELKKTNRIKLEELTATSSEGESFEHIEDASQKNPEEVVVDDDVRDILLDIINGLPQDQRIAVHLYYYQDMTVKEISQIFGCSEQTTRNRLGYARKNIKKEVDKLEDKGVQLRSIALLPFLYLIFQAEESFAQVAVPAYSTLTASNANASANTAVANAEMNSSAEATNTATTSSGAASTTTATASTAATAASSGTAATATTAAAVAGATKSAVLFGLSMKTVIAAIVAIVAISVGVVLAVKPKDNSNSDNNAGNESVVKNDNGTNNDDSTSNKDASAEDDNTETDKGSTAKKYLALPKKKYFYYDYVDADYLKEVTTYEYNDKHKVIKKTTTDAEGNLISTCQYKYDDFGNCISEIATDKDGIETSHVERAYNSKGILTMYAYAFGDNFPENIEEYDDNGNMIKREARSSGSVSVYTYDEKNRVLSYMYYHNDVLDYEEHTEYNDAKKESIKNYKTDRGANITVKSYYDDNGNAILVETYEGTGNELTIWKTNEYEYDSNNRVIHAVDTRYGKVSDEYFWTYNDNGDITEYIWKTDTYKGFLQKSKETRTFDSENRLLTYHKYHDEEDPYDSETYVYNEYGDIVEYKHDVSNIHKTITYEYDEKQGLIRATDTTLTLPTEIDVYENEYILLEE